MKDPSGERQHRILTPGQNCQEFLRTVITHMPPSAMPPQTSVAIVGCGSPTLITSYISELGVECPYPIYADPTYRLYTVLGMHRSLSLGGKDPDYIQQTILAGIVKSIVQGVKRIGAGDVTKAGDLSQNGGEFMFEVDGPDMETKPGKAKSQPKGNAGLKRIEVTFCHRMSNTRDHTEVPKLCKAVRIADTEEDTIQRRPERRWTSGPGVGGLARSLSNRRQSWLGKRSNSSLGRLRHRSRSRSGSLDDVSKDRSSEKMFETVREEVRSRDGEPRPAVPDVREQKDSGVGERASLGKGEQTLDDIKPDLVTGTSARAQAV